MMAVSKDTPLSRGIWSVTSPEVVEMCIRDSRIIRAGPAAQFKDGGACFIYRYTVDFSAFLHTEHDCQLDVYKRQLSVA